jgi:uncharacterized protein
MSRSHVALPRMTRSVALLATLAGLVLFSGATAMADDAKPLPRTVTVSASGQVGAAPDKAHVQTGVITEDDTAREALNKNTAAMSALIAGLKAAGIEPKDIQTTSFHIEPRYTNPKEGQVAVINGYRVVNQVDICANKIEKLGEVLDEWHQLRG